MDQVSRPALIALAATVALAALWLVVLRPKPVPVEDTPLAPTKAIPAARQASAASDKANARVQAATGGSAKAPAAAPTVKPAPAAAKPAPATAKPATGADPATAKPSAAVKHTPAKPDVAILREVRRGKVVVMLFWNAAGADDAATRGAIRSLGRHHGKVKVHLVPIGQVGDYGAITRQVKVVQSPTTLIIARGGRTRAIVGLTERQELGQAVSDALAGH